MEQTVAGRETLGPRTAGCIASGIELELRSFRIADRLWSGFALFSKKEATARAIGYPKMSAIGTFSSGQAWLPEWGSW